MGWEEHHNWSLFFSQLTFVTFSSLSSVTKGAQEIVGRCTGRRMSSIDSHLKREFRCIGGVRRRMKKKIIFVDDFGKGTLFKAVRGGRTYLSQQFFLKPAIVVKPFIEFVGMNFYHLLTS